MKSTMEPETRQSKNEATSRVQVDDSRRGGHPICSELDSWKCKEQSQHPGLSGFHLTV